MKSVEFDNLIGVFLVIASLIFDGLTSSQTDKEHKSSGRDYAYSIMWSNNFVQLIANTCFYLFSVVYSHENTLQRVAQDPFLLKSVMIIAISGALGQIFIYFAISLFNSYVLTIITTSRKLFSVVISNVAFHHHFTA